MFLLHSKIFKTQYAWELSMFHRVRACSDGVTFVEFIVNLDTYIGDHNPQCKLGLILLNHVIFEFNIYNVNHVEQTNEA